ncbi:MAG: T9SS type A sorting domain-containing protein [Bacteroidales bacterium]|nr:T9SS type A sorting domain-containing protein [Bacteroidales bacterium]
MIIYPNPVNDDFMNISFFAMEAGNCNYSIFSSDGRLVLAEELNCENGLNTIRLDVSLLEKAMYLIEMRAGEKIYRMQFLK